MLNIMPITKLTPTQLAQKMTNQEIIEALNKSSTANVIKKEIAKRILSPIIQTADPSTLPTIPTQTIITINNVEFEKQQKTQKEWEEMIDKKNKQRQEIEDTKTYTISQIQVVCNFDLRNADDGNDKTYFPALQTLIFTPKQDIRINANQIKTLKLKEAIKVRVQDIESVENWEGYNKIDISELQPTEFIHIYTGKTKNFKIKWLGSIFNNEVGQFEIIDN